MNFATEILPGALVLLACIFFFSGRGAGQDKENDEMGKVSRRAREAIEGMPPLRAAVIAALMFSALSWTARGLVGEMIGAPARLNRIEVFVPDSVKALSVRVGHLEAKADTADSERNDNRRYVRYVACVTTPGLDAATCRKAFGINIDELLGGKP